ncbi:hypothetical protein D3C81_1751510 [compost metagenome]
MPPLPTVARPKRITWGCSAARAAPNQLALRAATRGSSSLRFMGEFLLFVGLGGSARRKAARRVRQGRLQLLCQQISNH